MSPLRVIILGLGGRGRIYADYVRRHPESFTLAAAADPYGGAEFTDWRDALAAVFRGRLHADAAIIALPDRFHLAAGLRCLDAGLHILMEKPVGCTAAECDTLAAAVQRARRLIFPCYVLRYSVHYQRLFEIIDSGAIGDILSIHHLNAVSYQKTENNFCRGNWGKTSTSGPMILTKCCHDLDLLLRFAKGFRPQSVVSMGGQRLFKLENAPENSAERCAQCVTENCPFRIDGLDDVCVYRAGADVVDHQSSLIAFENGPIVNFELEPISARRGRFTRFFGTKGTLLSDDGDTPSIRVRVFSQPEQFIDTTSELHHGGGDEQIMEAFRDAILNYGDGTAETEEFIQNTLLSHRLAFAAEESRLKGIICRL